MLRAFVQMAALAAALGSGVWFASLPSWCFVQFLALGTLAASVGLLLGGGAAGLTATAVLAMQLSRPGSDSSLEAVICPMVALAAWSGVLACVVLKNPGLGRRIEHGPFGPGGV